MEARARIALAIGGGYLLGRTKKMRLALTLGGLAAGKNMSGPEGLVSQGFELLRNAPEFEDLRGDMRQRVLDAARTAALTATGNAIGRVTQKVNGRAALGESEEGDGSDEDYDDDYSEDEYEDSEGESEDDADEDETTPKPRTTSTTTRPRTSAEEE